MGVAEALRAQFAARREALDAGAEHVGWKLGMGDRERMDGGPVVIGEDLGAGADRDAAAG